AFGILFLTAGFYELKFWTESESRAPGDFGDPAGWTTTFGGVQFDDELRNRELNNGRFSMFAVIGILVAEQWTGLDGVDQFDAAMKRWQGPFENPEKPNAVAKEDNGGWSDRCQISRDNGSADSFAIDSRELVPPPQDATEPVKFDFDANAPDIGCPGYMPKKSDTDSDRYFEGPSRATRCVRVSACTCNIRQRRQLPRWRYVSRAPRTSGVFLDAAQIHRSSQNYLLNKREGALIYGDSSIQPGVHCYRSALAPRLNIWDIAGSDHVEALWLTVFSACGNAVFAADWMPVLDGWTAETYLNPT
ncbi:unnamed protein product, partial [Prorocentrum cordatum]